MREEVGRVDLSRYRGDVDILLASPPCQGHSRARGGDREGRDHEGLRSEAWRVVSKIDECRPEGFVIENVPDMRRWEEYGEWKSGLESAGEGYEVSEWVIDAADCGVPQNRARLFLVGSSRRGFGWVNPSTPHVGAEGLLDWESGDWPEVGGLWGNKREAAVRSEGRLGPRYLLGDYTKSKIGRRADGPIGTLRCKDCWIKVDSGRYRYVRAKEASRLMGFGEEYRLPDEHALCLRLVGNAVCPPVAESVVGQLAIYLGY